MTSPKQRQSENDFNTALLQDGITPRPLYTQINISDHEVNRRKRITDPLFDEWPLFTFEMMPKNLKEQRNRIEDPFYKSSVRLNQWGSGRHWQPPEHVVLDARLTLWVYIVAESKENKLKRWQMNYSSQGRPRTALRTVSPALKVRYGQNTYFYIHVERQTTLLSNELNTVDKTVGARRSSNQFTDTKMKLKDIYGAYLEIDVKMNSPQPLAFGLYSVPKNLHPTDPKSSNELIITVNRTINHLKIPHHVQRWAFYQRLSTEQVCPVQIPHFGFPHDRAPNVTQMPQSRMIKPPQPSKTSKSSILVKIKKLTPKLNTKKKLSNITIIKKETQSVTTSGRDSTSHSEDENQKELEQQTTIKRRETATQGGSGESVWDELVIPIQKDFKELFSVEEIHKLRARHDITSCSALISLLKRKIEDRLSVKSDQRNATTSLQLWAIREANVRLLNFDDERPIEWKRRRPYLRDENGVLTKPQNIRILDPTRNSRTLSKRFYFDDKGKIYLRNSRDNKPESAKSELRLVEQERIHLSPSSSDGILWSRQQAAKNFATNIQRKQDNQSIPRTTPRPAQLSYSSNMTPSPASSRLIEKDSQSVKPLQPQPNQPKDQLERVVHLEQQLTGFPQDPSLWMKEHRALQDQNPSLFAARKKSRIKDFSATSSSEPPLHPRRKFGVNPAKRVEPTEQEHKATASAAFTIAQSQNTTSTADPTISTESEVIGKDPIISTTENEPTTTSIETVSMKSTGSVTPSSGTRANLKQGTLPHPQSVSRSEPGQPSGKNTPLPFNSPPIIPISKSAHQIYKSLSAADSDKTISQPSGKKPEDERYSTNLYTPTTIESQRYIAPGRPQTQLSHTQDLLQLSPQSRSVFPSTASSTIKTQSQSQIAPDPYITYNEANWPSPSTTIQSPHPKRPLQPSLTPNPLFRPSTVLATEEAPTRKLTPNIPSIKRFKTAEELLPTDAQNDLVISTAHTFGSTVRTQRLINETADHYDQQIAYHLVNIHRDTQRILELNEQRNDLLKTMPVEKGIEQVNRTAKVLQQLSVQRDPLDQMYADIEKRRRAIEPRQLKDIAVKDITTEVESYFNPPSNPDSEREAQPLTDSDIEMKESERLYEPIDFEPADED